MDEPLPLLPGTKTDNGDKAYLFGAILQPNSSLDPKGFMILILAIASVSFVAGMIFMVAGFIGLDVALIHLTFKTNYRWARMYETVRLSQDSLLVERVSPSGKVQRWRFQPYWLRINLDSPGAHDSQLILSSHGKRLRIGAFLGPDERVELADVLTGALAGISAEHVRRGA